MKFRARLIVLLLLVSTTATSFAQESGTRPRNRFDTDILVETFGYDENTPGKVTYHELYQGCEARDCIPSIDQPKYTDVASVDFLADDELVLALEINGDARAYPAKILNYHEIVNDYIGGEPVAVTFCPLCGSGVAFDRRIDGEEVSFGVSGVLHDNDLVMYDRTSNTLWQQITGEAIMGEKLGQHLTILPMTMVEWGEWKATHPDTQVLTLDTGFGMDYNNDRYTQYIENDQIYFPVGNTSSVMHPKTVVHGIDAGELHFAINEKELKEKGTATVQVGEQSFDLSFNDDGFVIAKTDHGEEYTGIRLFWFAWYNFHPDTAVVKL